MLRALAHPDRRRFVSACRGELRAAGDLADLSQLSLATVSEHLKVLRKSGLLVLHKRGRFWLYQTDLTMLHHAETAIRQLRESG